MKSLSWHLRYRVSEEANEAKAVVYLNVAEIDPHPLNSPAAISGNCCFYYDIDYKDIV
jgi:hypothetical protein